MKKWTTTIVLSGILALSMPMVTRFQPFEVHASSVITNTLNETTLSSGSVRLSNHTLESKLKSLLGLSSTDELTADSLITSNVYNNSDPTKSLKSLDLSNTGITDITELRQFIWPKSLVAINLSNNGITKADFDKIKDFENYQNGDTITITANGESYDIYASGTQNDDGTISTSVSLSNINLMFNDINLSLISSNDLENSKYLFGIQGTSTWDENDLVLSSEINNVTYYFRSNDFNIIKGSMTKNSIEVPFTLGKITTLIESDDLGSVDFSFSNTTYYKDWSFKREYKVINVTLNSPVEIERRTLFHLEDNKINAVPKGSVTTQIINNYDTSKIGEYTFFVRAKYGNLTRDISLPYKVIDTTAPVLEYKGSSVTYWSKNKKFDYRQGITATDSSDEITAISETKTSKAESEIIASDYSFQKNTIVVVTNLDVTKLSGNTPYFIKYFCTDQSGNSAEPITRYVFVQEQALDTIVLRCNTKDTTVDSEIVLEVKPDNNIEMSNYSGFTYEYEWYVDGKFVSKTSGDFNAKSTKTFTFDSIGMKGIRVDLVAKKGTETIKLSSETLYLDISAKIDNTTIVLISFAVALLLIIMFFSIRIIIKVRRSKKKITKKASTSSYKGSNTNPNKPNITIVQGVNPRNQGSGGNINDRPPESSGNDMK